MGNLNRTRAHRPKWALLAAILGSSMTFIDGTAVNVALPILQRELNASAAAVQWVVEGYSLFLAALLIVGGALGDVFGRKRVYGAGVALFLVASLACALAPGIEALVAARCLQGVGAALATPGSLALVSAAYSGEARGRAIGTWSGFSAITAALGPVLGGWLIAVGSWRLVFAINVPLAIAVLVLLAAGVDESRDPNASRRIDVVGATLVTLGLGAFVYGLIRLQTGASDPIGLGAVALGCVALGLFVLAEARETHPMVDLTLFRSRAFTAANLYTFALYASIGGSLFFLPFDLINVQKYSPTEAGAALLPFVLIVFSLSRISGGLVVRIGARVPLVAGALLAAGGFVLFAFAGVGRSYWVSFFPGAVVLGFGGACFVAPLTTTVMDALPSANAGFASAVNNAVSRGAALIAVAALGIALAGAFGATFGREFAAAQLSAAGRSAALRERAQIAAGSVPPDVREPGDRLTLGRIVSDAYTDGFRLTMFLAAGLSLAAAGIGLDPSFRRMPSSR